MSGGFSSQVRQRAWERAEGCCERCDQVLPLCCGTQYHHRRPRGAGGSRRADTNTLANCLLLGDAFSCGCHEYIESHRTEALEKGWLVRQSKSPLETPVLYRGRWVLLGNDGDVYQIPEVAS